MSQAAEQADAAAPARRVVELENVCLLREGSALLDHISIGLEEGKCTVVMGASGSGASCFLKTAAGIMTPSKGKVLAWGQDIETMSAQEQFIFREKLGFVFQDAALWANMSGFQNIALPFQFHRRGMSQEEIAARIADIAQEFEFQGNLQLRPVGLSTGERKLISFMRAMILEPPMLFLDDPTGSIDNTAAKHILRILLKYKEEGRTLIMATHDPVYTLRLADNLIILRHGKMVEHGAFASVRASRDPYIRDVLSESLHLPDGM
ncbi:MAG: ATP-binding cassette domain-containing protein [Spirochaetales bacterium]|nr:ATP-binding cassette domain-containing protein [Spirochaetales bacterium]